ncbi:MAG: hypothetical protein WDO16_25230 [Bacteroidota bacterium]
MNVLFYILKRSVAAPYYRQHAGFFLFCFFLLFGIQPSLHDALIFHYSIIQSILSSSLFFWIAAGLWFIYAFKTVHFFFSCIKKDTYTFLLQLLAVSLKKRVIALAYLQAILFLPAWIYGLIIFIIGVKEDHLASGLYVMTTLVLLSAVTLFLFIIILEKGKTFSFFPAWLKIRYPAKFSFILLRYVLTEQFAALLITKLFTFFGLYSLARLEKNYFDDRILWLYYISSLAGHCLLVYRNHHFTEKKLAFYRNLPVKPVQTLLSFFIVYTILLLPEFWALKGLATHQQALAEYGWILLAGPSVLLLLHCLLYTEDFSMESFLQLVFGLWIVLLFFSLSSWKWMTALVCSSMALFIFHTSYYNYEKKAEVEKLE